MSFSVYPLRRGHIFYFIERAGGGVDGDKEVLTGLAFSPSDCLHNDLEGLLVAFEIGSEPSFVADGGI